MRSFAIGLVLLTGCSADAVPRPDASVVADAQVDDDPCPAEPADAQWPANAVVVEPGASIEDALRTGRPVALAAGEHVVDELRLDGDAVLEGAGAGATRLAGRLRVTEGASVAVRRLSVHTGGIVARDATVGLDTVRVCAGEGIEVSGGRLVGVDLELVDNGAVGLLVEDATADLRGGRIEGHAVGVLLVGHAHLNEREVEFSDNGQDRRSCAERCVPEEAR